MGFSGSTNTETITRSAMPDTSLQPVNDKGLDRRPSGDRLDRHRHGPRGHLLTRVIKSVVANFAGQLVNIAGNLLLVPLFLSCWSAGVYGEWMALSALVSYFGITDLGMNSAAGNVITAAYARGDLARYRFLQGSAMAFYVGMASAVSLLAGILIVVFPVPLWIGVCLIPPSTASWVVWVLAARIMWQMPAGQIGNIYRSMGNIAASQWVGNLQSFGLLLVTTVVLLLHAGVLNLALWGAAPMVLATLGAWCHLRRSHGELLPNFSAARISGIRELVRPSLKFGLIMVSIAVASQGPVLLVSGILGGAAVALLVTTRTLGNVIRQVVGTLMVALWPELTRMDATGAAEALRYSHRLLVAGSTGLCAAFAGALWFEGAEVIAVWTRGKLVPDIWLLRLFLLALALQAPWWASSAFTATSNRHGNLSYSYAGSAVLTLMATAILIHPCGLLAVPLGAILGEAVACYHFVIKDTCQVLREDYPRYAAQLWRGVAAIFFAAWGAGWLGHLIAFGPAPLRWVQIGGLTTLASLLSASVVALRKEERSLLVHWGKSRWFPPRQH
jgi:O-antigen/teichoic acid export membrane protein